MQNWIGEKTLHILGGKNNFDIIRYYLSFAVFFAHFGILTNTNYFLPTSSVDAVHGFFVLSGFFLRRNNFQFILWGVYYFNSDMEIFNCKLYFS